MPGPRLRGGRGRLRNAPLSWNRARALGSNPVEGVWAWRTNHASLFHPLSFPHIQYARAVAALFPIFILACCRCSPPQGRRNMQRKSMPACCPSACLLGADDGRKRGRGKDNRGGTRRQRLADARAGASEGANGSPKRASPMSAVFAVAASKTNAVSRSGTG